ncbi:hypothetical protein FOVG_13046 [Fusarium oxysporum f. sp. pisi HDV247]|uniref:Uncharacterized protein n=2 Tax=Fusarium oxysporum TaxID=5507 RepID=X0L147_FUSOX|nr:hypothetical protein FOVG_13046 [Fusarium oxysporum f. sp. pisi HDV247]EXM19619.1 hypothetical protein FOTG_12471 [Fusarium oxysporum f. sp. vasinfectum 25433]
MATIIASVATYADIMYATETSQLVGALCNTIKAR